MQKPSFEDYLNEFNEVGFVDQIVHSIVYASGLPTVRPHEIVIFESGSVGQVLSLDDELAEILLLSGSMARAGERIAKTGRELSIPVGEFYLGHTVDALGGVLDGSIKKFEPKESRPVDIEPMGILERKPVDLPLETGVSVVDLTVPLGKGQRELVIGDKNTGKTRFLLQVILTQARKGTICIYCGVGKKKTTIKRVAEFFKSQGVDKNTLIVASTSEDPSGVIYITPFAAMTHAEYFRDQGKDVLIVIDDLTVHAKFYREITLLLQRFPGRSAYPGDIFYTHARLLERAGDFEKASITCLPVADTVMGDLTGFIQTNLMAMTDGHIFFDIDIFNQGRRPAINPFLSVTRVGLQAQRPLVRDLSRQLNSFLVEQDKLRQFLHFGAELSEDIQRKLALGDKIYSLFEQLPGIVVPEVVSVYLVAALWAGMWRDKKVSEAKTEFEKVIGSYGKDKAFGRKIDDLINAAATFTDLVTTLKRHAN
ncbi:hypothetical protein A2630_04015 [Candidatus Woesebacteria bacterium RIFCSPHIGHO2_01_FULL_44_10]|uniref:ATPase F1/V1/A1 complex alpha/beta subunit nucleotide-binding domain-containing protein n=1 Tax=Candidatus Woesebacteria bacterium RIFCSPLOWO2_01_FULL_44_14 TaxID=1802525 RepID=A0A1F8C2D4_9BACT|nr:MAG: hypothetical protein A2630_04015 [Candidatus Woesebacteria bacterium RIFCSPHIGHO2_01_FULL_44_10]OGM54518.1 MAG: hypothetical protein A3F62_03205 [Candidatus Woesebacteria bacterium RIFCSPHIGHO2_12_FULL_44_11]OGM70412.1 MAG: hypothetical protein A2975_01765 [Candidatus Woesebacteria bacterium RIFCSPLOWO2_01_FULL_44_14]